MLGFSLMEIIIVLLIVSILSLQAIPLYTQPRLAVQQSIAKVALFKVANSLEQHYLHQHTFRGFVINDSLEYYDLSLVKLGEESYTLAAIPKNKVTDDLCGTFFLDQDGMQSVSGSAGVVACW
jgi:type IV pilus assembly protein PilE